jgi:hypothetical protein
MLSYAFLFKLTVSHTVLEEQGLLENDGVQTGNQTRFLVFKDGT